MAKKPLYNASLMPADAKTKFYKDIEEWFKLSDKLTELIDHEKTLRTAIFETYFAANGVEEGTNHIDLEFGKQLTADYRINRKIDEAQLDAAIALGHIDRALVDQLFRYKPSLNIGEWKDAPVETRFKFADIVTETPGTPGLRITTPKR